MTTLAGCSTTNWFRRARRRTSCSWRGERRRCCRSRWTPMVLASPRPGRHSRRRSCLRPTRSPGCSGPRRAARMRLNPSKRLRGRPLRLAARLPSRTPARGARDAGPWLNWTRIWCPAGQERAPASWRPPTHRPAIRCAARHQHDGRGRAPGQAEPKSSL